MGQNNIKISVIIPVYNVAQYIAQTLDCIYAQTIDRQALEIICVLDACTDNSADIIRRWGRDNNDITMHIIMNKKNRGPAISRNQGLRHARGEFIHFMDSDDVINTDFYKSMYTAATGASADLAVCCFYNERHPHSSVIYHSNVVYSNPQDKVDQTWVDTHGYMVRYLIRRQFWDENKFKFPENIRFCEDWLLANEMVYAARRLVTVADARYIYKFRKNSLMMQSKTNTDYQVMGASASRAVDKFLVGHYLFPHSIDVHTTDWRLFGMRLFKIERDLNHVCVRLFGRIKIIRQSQRVKYKRREVSHD